MKNLANKAQEEAEYLRTVLQGIGFNIYTTRTIEDCLDRAMEAMYHVVDCYNIKLDRMTVGNCYVYRKMNNILLFTSTLNAGVIPEEMINQLLLLGYENDDGKWLDYEREIK